MNKKILLIDDNVHTFKKGAPLFNIERKYLEDNGFEVYTLGFSTKEEDLDSSHQRVVQEKKSLLGEKTSKFLGDKEIQSSINYHLKDIVPDIIHCHLLTRHALNVYSVLPSEVPTVQTLHGPNFFCPTSWGCIKKDSSFCELGVGSKCHLNGCVSFPLYLAYKKLDKPIQRLLKEKVNTFHCPSKQIEAVANFHGYTNTLDIPLGLRKEFTEAALEHDNYGSQKVIYIGQMHEVKGVEYLLQAFKSVVKHLPNAELQLAGKGPHLQRYIDQVKKDEIKNVTFLGHVKQEVLIERLRDTDLCIVPSIWSEQFGMVGPEALACKVPVIGSDIGGIPEWLKEDWGWLVKPRSITDLSQKIIEGLENPAILEKKGRLGQEYILENHSAKTYCSKLIDIFNNL